MEATLPQGQYVVNTQGKKTGVLTSEALSELFDCPLHVVAANGYYQVLPAG